MCGAAVADALVLTARNSAPTVAGTLAAAEPLAATAAAAAGIVIQEHSIPGH